MLSEGLSLRGADWWQSTKFNRPDSPGQADGVSCGRFVIRQLQAFATRWVCVCVSACVNVCVCQCMRVCVSAGPWACLWSGSSCACVPGACFHCKHLLCV